MEIQKQDRVGLGWRPELAAGIFANLEHIDVLEVIAEEWFNASRDKAMALRTLATQVAVQLHGTSAGLASAARVDDQRLEKMARLVEIAQPEAWSEHLAFVRAGGTEIGHLAAVPRTMGTVADVAANINRARQIVGLAPMMENIATLIDPPASRMKEVDWLRAVVTAADAPLLLDLHNLYANTVNFGGDRSDLVEALGKLPLDRVTTVHIAGGRWLPAGRTTSEGRLLDDHLHPVPQIVYDMLEELAAITAQPLTVILERDGAYSGMPTLLLELDLARSALRRGRARRAERAVCSDELCGEPKSETNFEEDRATLEILLARIFADAAIRSQFLSTPHEFACRHGLSEAAATELAELDRPGLEMAARSFQRKRQLKRAAAETDGWLCRMMARLSPRLGRFAARL